MAFHTQLDAVLAGIVHVGEARVAHHDHGPDRTKYLLIFSVCLWYSIYIYISHVLTENIGIRYKLPYVVPGKHTTSTVFAANIFVINKFMTRNTGKI
jgi:hypothetical protein